MFENVDGRTTDAEVIGILIAHLGAFGSGQLKIGGGGVISIFFDNDYLIFVFGFPSKN